MTKSTLSESAVRQQVLLPSMPSPGTICMLCTYHCKH